MEKLLPARVIAGEEGDTRSLYELMAEHHVPAVSIALVDDNRIVAARSFGWADPQARVPAHLDTRFQAASISKSVAAYALMALAEKGAVDVDVPVDSMLTTWQLPAGEHDAPTLRTLLSHRAGTNVSGFRGYAKGEVLPSAVGVLAGEGNSDAVSVTMPPGSFRYSGGGYTIAQQAVEDHINVLFETLMAQNVLGPLEMIHSTYEQPAFDAGPSFARAHDSAGRAIEGGYHVYPELAAAGLWSTPSDLAKFLIAANETLSGADAGPVSTDGLRAMTAPPATPPLYGLGFTLRGEGEDFHFGHSGSNVGFKSLMLSFPERGEALVIMANGEQGRELLVPIVNAVSAQMGWGGYDTEVLVPAPADTTGFAAIAGRYRMGEDVYVFEMKDGAVRMTGPDGKSERVTLLADGRLYLHGQDALPEVVRNPSGTVTGLRFQGQDIPKID
ncbi:serine hydrolase domain-containing protein [Sphingomicrobium sp. XHP0235]|uniref:serine hydrolase domain-containing protein n=1 Tax=Sphingomicrobium aquimarinum TaxID=3133971 RepID=UPI0031FE5475